ncbi:MAG: outer membrane protein assembly factor BamD [Paucimonas sp.]|jgi:outer membrane protein assembly factor BamD|nr:outer membrane protein assembly factor BamD [Paucimonas sp.]
MRIHFLKFTLAALALSLSACSILQSESPDETRGWSAAKLYSEARGELAALNYEKSLQLLEKLESRYPFGTYAQQAQMDAAYVHYKAGDQALALAAIERFIKLHPDHPNVDYMYYLRGLVNFNDRKGILDFLANQDASERDQKALRESFDSFRLLVERFPKSIYAQDASDRLGYLLNSMALYDVHVARYYYRRGAYLAAVNRAQAAVQNYRESPAIEEALWIMVRSYDALGMPKLRDDTQRVFQKNFPNSDLTASGERPGSTKKTWWKIWQ